MTVKEIAQEIKSLGFEVSVEVCNYPQGNYDYIRFGYFKELPSEIVKQFELRECETERHGITHYTYEK